MPASDYQKSLDAQYENDLRESQRQQAEAEREATRQQKEQAQQQKESAKEQQRQSNNIKEADFRAQKRPQYVDAYGDIQPTHSDEDWQQQQETARTNAASHNTAALSGRKFTTNKVTGAPLYLESEQALAKRRDAEAEKTRQSQLDAQIKAVDAEHNDTFAKHAAEGVKPLTETARKKLAEKAIPQTKQEALAALQSHYQNLSAQKSGDADWIPFNESPTPEATAAAEHLKRLQSPDADLTEEDLATLAGNDATKPLATRLQNQQGMLTKDDELQKLKADHALRVADLKLRRDAPDKWTESVRARRAAMSPEELKADLEASGADLDARTAALQQQATSLNEQVAAHTQQLDTLSQQAEQRRQQGIPAGDLVSYQGADGTVEHWPKDLAAQRETIAARLQETQSQQQSDWAALKAQEKELQHEATLHNEAAQLLQTTQKAKVEEAKKADLTHLQFTPGHEQTAQELAALDEESQTRMAALLADREPYASELEFFKANPHVAGMAAEDDKVILNPFATHLSYSEKQAVVTNERARIQMRTGPKPDFELTPAQKREFQNYGSEQDIRETVAARILSGDPSAGTATKEQQDWVKQNLTIEDRQPAPEAMEAIQKDIQQRRQAALGLGESRRLAGIAAADDLKRFSQYYDKDGFGYSQTEIDQRRAAIGKNLSQVLGITPEAADHLISDAQAQDWSPPQLPVSKGLLADTVEVGAKWLVDSVESIYKPAKEEEKTRLLSTGGIAVNPSITKEQDYRKAVEDSKATPEAKAEALSRYPAVREQAGQKVLDGIHEIGSIYGPDTIADYTSTLKNKPKDVSEAEWAMRFTENLKAEARHGILNTLKSVGWEAWQSFNEGFIDQRAMASGLSAGALPNGLGSETMMKDAQWANRKAAALDTGLEIGGDQSTNPIAAGLFHQAPRFIGSLIGPGIAAKGAGGALSIFAKSKLGTKLLPSVAALLAKTAAPARAAASVDRITKAMKAGKLTVAEADAHVAKSLLSASSIAAPTAAQTVQAVKALTRAGIGGAAAAGAAQTYGAQITDIYTALKAQHPEMSHADALRAAQVPSLLSAGVTAMLTVLVPGGSDRFLARPAVAKELFKKQFASQLQRLGYMGKEFLKGGGQEFIEEAPDELFSQYQAGVASNPDDPTAGTKAVAAYFDNLAALAVGVGVLGGVPGSITAHGTSSIQRPAGPTQTALLPETQAAADAAIQNHRHLDANNVEIPEFTQATQQRAALALATARGGDLFDATEKQLNAAGWTRRDSQGRDMPPGKFARLKDYTGPNVLNIDTTGAAHIDPQYLSSLKETLPAVAAAIPDEATKPSPINEPTSTTDTSTAKPGTTPEGQTPANGPGPNANPSPVQTPAQSGAEPAPSGTLPPQSGTPVAAAEESAATPARSSTAVPTTEQSIADWLVDRHMPDAEAAAAAKAITSHPDMAGKDYDHFTRQITARDALLQSLGITGSTSKKQAAANPLRFRSDVGTPARTSGSDSGPSETPPTKNEEPGTNNSPSLPPSVQAALDDSIPGTPSQEVFDSIKKAVQAKELTEQDATTLVAQQSGAQDHTELRQALENKLGWNTTRANTAAALHFGDKSKSDIPLAAAERAANRVPSGSTPSGNSANSVNPVQNSGSVGPEPELASAPSALTQNDDYARAKLAALSRIKDPTQKSWARQLFALIEKTFEKHHLLYDALATGAVARKHLGGQFTAVMVIDGKVTRLIDLDAMVGQFSHIENPAAALRATGIEEDVHALVLQLSRKNPEKYGYPALVKKWKALPDKLKQTVWQSYNNADSSIQQNAPLPANLSSKDEWHMMNEFLRMLVQDKHFAGQITETVDAAPGLIQWVKDLLKDLGNILRNLLKDAPPALQKDIKSMVAEIGQRLKDIEKPSAATAGTRLETIPTLADTQGVTQQTLTSLLKDGQGILSPAALARIWDQLDPALQKRVFAQKERTPRQATLLKLPYTAATRAPKHELMQELLTLLLTDPAAAQSLLDTPKSTNLLNKLAAALFPTKSQAPNTRNAPLAALQLAALHAGTLRFLGSITGARFVQSLPPAVAQAVTTAPPAVTAKILAARAQAEAPTSSPPASASGSGIPLLLDSLAKTNGTESPTPEPIHPRAADFLAAIEAAEKDHTDAANDEGQAKLRAKLRLQEIASIRAQFFLRDNAAREQHQATQAGRQDVGKATDLQDLALGRIGARRPASAWRTLGLTERRRLALLGIGVDQHPHTVTGGYVYSLARIETAEARVEFSLAGTAENQMAQEELDWMRRQPAEFQTKVDPLSPAYVEKDHVIIKQSTLDDLALSYPHTAALILPEWQIRQSYGRNVAARLPVGKETAGHPRQPSGQPAPSVSASTETSESLPPALTPIPEGRSAFADNVPITPIAPKAKPVTFDVPVKGEGTITATFPDTASREAFQFKHDLARSRKLPSGSERTKLETSLSALKARFMADLGLGDDAVTTKLAAYHEHVVAAAAEHAAKNRIGGITAPQFEAFSGGRSAPSTKSLPAPVGGDLIADLSRYGIGRISSTVQPGKAGDMDWFKSVTDGTAGPHKQTALILAVKAADAGELTTPLARRIWLAGTAGLGLTPAQARWERPGHVLAPNGMPIDAAASTLSSQQADGSGTPYQFESGDALGLAILDALDSRIAAKGQAADPTLSAESDAQEQSRNFATLISGNQDSGQSMTGAEIAAQLDPDTSAENTLKLGTAWFTVDSQDDTGLHLTASGPDADLYGQQTLAPDQSYPVTQINDTPLGSSSSSFSSSSSERSDSAPQSPESIEAQRSALPADQRDIFQRRALETIHRELPPEQLATPQDIAELQRDYQESVAAGESLDESTPDLDLDDDIADSADAYLDGEPLPASRRTTPEQRTQEITGATAKVNGQTVQTGQPVTFRFLHNKESATKIYGKPKKDSHFDRGFEPSGRFVTEARSNAPYLLENFPQQYETGELTFENPIVIDWGSYGTDASWKRRLSTLYGNIRGKKLSQAILDDGFDGIITTDKDGHSSEILDLTTFDSTKALYAAPRELSHLSLSTGWLGYPQPRGELTKPKLIQYLKDAVNKPVSRKRLSQFVLSYNGAQDLLDHTYYHGTSNFISGTVKPSITLSDRQAEQMGGGGYGEKYWAVSLSKDKRTAESFSGQSRGVSIHPVLLKKAAKVITLPDVQDAADLEDHILDLWKNQVDAVWIGGGEQELAVINPKAIVFAADSDYYAVFGGYKSENFTLEKAEAVRAQAQSIVDTYDLDTHPKLLFAAKRTPDSTLPQPRLTALHNLSYENLVFADRLGGLAAPSIAVTPKGQGMSGFGQITLIGTRDLVDPSKEPVFDADAYSPRFPDAEYSKAKSKDAQKIVDAIRPFAKSFDDRSLTDTIWDNAVNRPRPADTVEKMLRSDAAKAAFLATQGIQVQPVMKPTSITHEVVHEPAFAPFRADPQSWFQTDYHDPAAMQRLGQIVKEADQQKIEKLDLEPDLKDYLRKQSAKQFKDNGALLFGIFDRIGRDLKNLGTETIDHDATRKAVSTAMEGKEAEFKQWAENLILPLHPAPQLTLKGRKVPYTLDNITAAMTGRVRGREDTMAFGEGAARAHISKKFTDLEQMRKAATTQILPEDQVSAARDRAQKLLATYREQVAEYTTLTNYRGNPDHFAAFDAAMRALVTWAKGRKDTAALANGLRREGFKDVPAKVLNLGQQAAEAWLNAPVPYFEAKPQRAVSLREFAGAVIPDSAPSGIAKILDKHGIQHRTYTGDTTAQAQAAAQFAQDLNSEDSPTLFAAPRTVEHVEPGFYSALAEAIRAKMPARSTPSTVVGILKNAGIKTEELKWTGILPWLQQQAQNGPITQQQVLDYLANEGAVLLQEVRLGGSQTNLEDANRAVIAQAQSEGMTKSGAEDYALSAARGDLSPGQLSFISPAMRPLVARLRASYEARASEYAAGQSQPKYSQYQLPGGTNYREVVLTMPGKEDRTKIPEGYQLVEGTGLKKWEVYGPDTGRYAAGQTPSEAIENFWDLHGKHHDLHAYTSSHFQYIPNYVAHMRLNDRTDAEGKDGTFIEEIQSDRHQAGREKGYQISPEKIQRHKELREKWLTNSLTEQEGAEFDSLGDQYNQSAAVPDAPFRTSWPLQMFKRALVDAVASGKQWIGWTTGDTQAKRYDLSQQVSFIQTEHLEEAEGVHFVDIRMSKGNDVNLEVENGIVREGDAGTTGKPLSDVIGKEMAEKILSVPQGKQHRFSGVDLALGGEGMKGFYDTILPKEIGKYVKQWSAGVQQSKIEEPTDTKVRQRADDQWAVVSLVGQQLSVHETEDEAIEASKLYHPIWRIDITPQMKAGVEAGQALFAAPRRAYESMTFDPPFHTRFGDILSYDWMNQPVGGLSSQRTSDWSRARTNPATGRDIVHHFKVQKPDGIHTVSLETALGQLTEPQRHKLQSLIKSEQRRREEAAAGQMTLFAGQRVTPEQDAEYMAAVESGDVAKQQAMVDAAAKDAGYTTEGWHGSKSKTKFTAFDDYWNGSGADLNRNADLGEGFYFTPSKEDALGYARYDDEKLYHVWLRLDRPATETDLSKHGDYLKYEGFDGVMSGDGMEYTVFNPNQIKSADPITRDAEGNVIPLSQRFNPDSNSILFAAQRVEAAAAETDRNPSDAQKAAGNYPKGKVTLHGLRLSIENPRGSVRSGTDATGKPWSVTMPHHYGYFLGTEGKDGDHVDFFLGPNPDSQQVLIINQRKVSSDVATPGRTSVSGRFDEHKIMLGFDSPIAAARAYLASYTPGWRGFGSAVPTTIPVLKEWLENHDTTKLVTRESIAKIAQTLPLKNPEIPANSVNPVQNLDSGILPAASRLQRTLDKAQSLDRRLATLPGASTTAKALDKSVTGIGQAANLIPTAVGKAIQGITGLGEHLPGNQALATLGTRLGAADAAAASAAGHAIANALQRVSGKDIRKAPDAVAAWLNKPDGLGSWTKNTVVDQFLPTALMPREWLALSHEMQRKTAFGAEKSNDLVRALSGNPRLSDLAYPTEFAQNPAYREQLFDAMENKIPMDSLPPAMQALAQRLRAMLRETGLELVRQGLMHPDTFEELQSNGWMPRYMLEEAQESAGSLLAAFKLGIQDLRQQRSTAYHIVDTTRRGKDGQYLTVNRQEGGRNAWRFRDAATRDAFYSDFIRRQALDMLQDTHGNTKELQTMMATLDGQQRREVRSQIQLLTRADMDAPAKLSQALAGMVKQAIELQKAKYKKEAPFDPPKLIKDPVYAIARYILAQTHNAATMELLNETAKNKDWTSSVSLQGFTPIPDQTRFGPLAGKFVQKDIAQQILDKLDVPNAALRFYDAILRKWKSGKLVWNPGSHIRDAVGNTVFAYLGGSSLANPGNWPYYRQAMEIMRNGGPLYNELLEHGVLGGDAYSSLVRERLKGLLPDAKTVENFNPGLIQRFFLDFGSKFHGTHEQLAEYRRMPDDFYKIAAYLKAKDTLTEGSAGTPARSAAAAAHVRKWFPYYDRLGGSSTTRAAGRFVNPFLSFFRESSRILLTAAKERPIALSAALAFPAAISALSAMLLGLDDRDKDEIGKDLAGRGKGILGLSNLHLFSMLLPFRSSQGQVQQWDISSIMPFADLLGQKVVPLEEKENAWQTFWRQTAAAGPIGNLGVSWITNRDLFSGRHLTEADMSTPEMLRAYTQHAAGVALPPLAPDLAAAVGIGDGGALTKAGQRQVNKTLQTYDPVQTVIRSVFGMNIKSAAPNIYRQAEDFRKAHGYDAQPGFDYGTTVTSRAKRLLVQELAQDEPNTRRITALATRLKALGVPLETSGDIAKVLKIIDPSQIMNGSKKSGLSAEQARQQFRQSLPPESRTLYEASLSEFERIKQKASLLLR